MEETYSHVLQSLKSGKDVKVVSVRNRRTMGQEDMFQVNNSGVCVCDQNLRVAFYHCEEYIQISDLIRNHNYFLIFFLMNSLT